MNPGETATRPAWCMAGGDPQRTGRFGGPVKLASTPLPCLETRAAVQAPVVFDGADRALVADMAGTVRAYTGEGRVLWERTLEGGVAAAPAVQTASGLLFVGTLAGSIYALETRSGATAWRLSLPSETDPRIVADLLVAPVLDLVITSSWGGRFCALTGDTGKLRFAWNAGISPRAAVSADHDGNLYCLRAMREGGIQLVHVDGEGAESILYRAEAGPRGAVRTLVAAAPVLDAPRGRLYWILNADRTGHLCAWSLVARDLLWRYAFDRAVAATPAVRADGVVLVADRTGGLQAIAPDGSLAFQCKTSAEYLLAPPVCDAMGRAFVSDPTGGFRQLEPDGGCRVLFEAPRALQTQASFDRRGRLYLPCTDRRVYVFRNLVGA